MRVLRDRASLALIDDPELRTLIEQRIEALAEFDDYPLDELVNFIVVQPGDSIASIDEQLGRPVLGPPGFAPTHELIEEHAGYYELVYVLSDDGFGIEVFIPKHPGVDPALLAKCAAQAEAPDS